MYMRTSFRGAKGCVFGHVHKFWKDKMEKSMQKHIFKVYFHT